MNEKPTYQNKIGKIVKQDSHTITIEDQYGKEHTLAKEPGGKIHGMLEGTANGDAGEWNKNRNGFCVFWSTTKKSENTNTVKSVSSDPLPAQEVKERAEKAGFVVTPDAQNVIAKENADGDARIKENEVATIEIMEDHIKSVMKLLPQSERTGCRIALMSALNSALEIRAQSNDQKMPLKDLAKEIRKEALGIFLWEDSLTTGLFIKRE